MKKKTILIALLTIALCFSIISGATFALFTSESSVNIVVSSGKVEVVAHIENLKLYSGVYNEEEEQYESVEQTENFLTGGTAEINDNKLVLNSIVPMDKVTFDIVITNNSNVNVIYQTVANLEKGLLLYQGLVITIGEEEFNGGAAYSEWKTWLTTDEEQTITIPVSIELPYEAGNEYQDKTCELSFNVYALQGNVVVNNGETIVDGVTYTITSSVEEAEEILAEGKDVLLASCVTTETIVIPENSGSLMLQNVIVEAENGNAIYAEKDANIVIAGDNKFVGSNNSSAIKAEGALTITGNGILTAIGNGDTEDESVKVGGSAIEASSIEISGLSELVALGNGLHGFGIGGYTTSISISDTYISSVKGGYDKAEATSYNSYGKNAPEGGAAIGSSYNGATISLNNVVIDETLGGSKSAGIGAYFHTGVTINITECTINKVVGGIFAAGIGGSRVSQYNSENEDITITIVDSTITAIGGYYGAGIGSGYDTYCHTVDKAAMCTINIKGDSNITATGGQYAAGIGTGYHAGGLDGEIETSVVVNATAGNPSYNPEKTTYTAAMAVGFGVLDLTRDGKDNNCTITYQGVEVGVPAVATNE